MGGVVCNLCCVMLLLSRGFDNNTNLLWRGKNGYKANSVSIIVEISIEVEARPGNNRGQRFKTRHFGEIF